MTPQQMQHACELFDAALQRAPNERCAFLAEACGSDANLRAEVESLLQHDSRAEDAFLRPAQRPGDERFGDAPEHDARIGTRVGGFLIQRVIAIGGMGTVYEAVQERPQRVVALKVMKGNIAARTALRRFEFEAQVLGRLRHPNIAQVYQAGVHHGDTGADGAGRVEAVPYFAMEFIPGARSITRYADDEHLSTHDRLKLFAKVCDAVHHGHQRGIIHRDLKPANILVDSAGEPKVIDFGVARATDADLSVTTQQTCVGQLVGTVQYMSPEQCDADPHDLDTRSDVYSLGVVLYELLTGQLPYEATNTTLYAATRAIKEQQPPRPSTINRRLRGDIETIVLKALEKDRTRRYQSAGDLAEDIQHYLHHEPIAARAPTAWTRGVHWVARHPLLATTTGSIAIAGCVLAATSLVISYLHRQPTRLAFYLDSTNDQDEGVETRLFSRSNRELKSWGWQEGVRFAQLLDRPKELGGDKVVALGFKNPSNGPWPGHLCLFDAYSDFTHPIWKRRVELDEILPELRICRNAGVEQFTLSRGWLLDVFPERPGDELVVAFGRWMYSQSVIRVYDLRGELLYQVWHDGVLTCCRMISDAGLLVFSGDCHWPYHDRYGKLLGQRPNDMVLFALRPKSGFIADSYLDYLCAQPGDAHLDPAWYLRLLPSLSPEDIREGLPIVLSRPNPPLDQRCVVLFHVLVNRAWRGGVQWVVDEYGREVPGSRIVGDAYKSNQELAGDDPKRVKLPDPAEFRLVPMTVADVMPGSAYLDTSPLSAPP